MAQRDVLGDVEQDMADIQDKLAQSRAEIQKVIFGQGQVVDKTIITLLAGGHVLLVGVPGLAKTLLVDTLSKVLGLSTGRIQSTPDLMPADIIGSEVLEEDQNGKRHFRFIPGPIFAQFVMADEINRATPRTQSALLQAMQEHMVTIGGHHHKLPAPFHVLATQNPIEQEGTYPLPEAQLDRFLMQVDVDYPNAQAERDMVLATTGAQLYRPQAIFDADDLIRAQHIVRLMPVGDQVVDGILKLVRLCRPIIDGEQSLSSSSSPSSPSPASPDAPLQMVQDYIQWGPGPRASQAMMLACRAKALLDGRLTPSLQDVAELAVPVLKHRMALHFRARADNVTRRDVIRHVVDHIMAG